MSSRCSTSTVLGRRSASAASARHSSGAMRSRHTSSTATGRRSSSPLSPSAESSHRNTYRIRKSSAGRSPATVACLQKQLQAAGEARVKAYNLMNDIDASLKSNGLNTKLPHAPIYWLFRKEYLAENVGDLLVSHRPSGATKEQLEEQERELSFLRARRDWLASFKNWDLSTGRIKCMAVQPHECRNGAPLSLLRRASAQSGQIQGSSK